MPQEQAPGTDEALLIETARAIRLPDFHAELSALVSDYRKRCLQWLLAAEDQKA